jgi:hypothetical protein
MAAKRRDWLKLVKLGLIGSSPSPVHTSSIANENRLRLPRRLGGLSRPFRATVLMQLLFIFHHLLLYHLSSSWPTLAFSSFLPHGPGPTFFKSRNH